MKIVNLSQLVPFFLLQSHLIYARQEAQTRLISNANDMHIIYSKRVLAGSVAKYFTSREGKAANT